MISKSLSQKRWRAVVPGGRLKPLSDRKRVASPGDAIANWLGGGRANRPAVIGSAAMIGESVTAFSDQDLTESIDGQAEQAEADDERSR